MPGSASGRVGRLLILLAVLGVIGGPTAEAESGQRVGEFVLGNLRIPPPRGYVNDLAGVLTPAQARELETLCRDIDRRTSAEVALVILPTVAGEAVAEVRTRLFETWKIGDAQDDRGLLILHALEERRIEVETGYGLEAILPDATVGAILSEHVAPSFREGRYFEGYKAGLLVFGQWILEGPGARAGRDAYRGRAGKRGLPIGGVLLGIILLYLFIRHPRLALLLLVMNMGGRRGYYGGGGGFGGGFGGFGGGASGGGGAGVSY